MVGHVKKKMVGTITFVCALLGLRELIVKWISAHNVMPMHTVHEVTANANTVTKAMALVATKIKSHNQSILT